MHTKRIIPCLDVHNGRVVKGVNFVNLQAVSYTHLFDQKAICLYIYRINGRHNFIVLVY